MDCEWTEYGETECQGTCGTGKKTVYRKNTTTMQNPTLYDPQVPDYNHPVLYTSYYYNIYHSTVKTCHGEPNDVRICSLKPCPSMYFKGLNCHIGPTQVKC